MFYFVWGALVAERIGGLEIRCCGGIAVTELESGVVLYTKYVCIREITRTAALDMLWDVALRREWGERWWGGEWMRNRMGVLGGLTPRNSEGDDAADIGIEG